MKNIYCLLWLLALQGYEMHSVASKAVSAKTVSAQDRFELKNVRNFDVLFVEWKRSLTKQQIQYFKDLFVTYDDLYSKYKARPGSEREYELIMNMINILKHIMDQWGSFYKDYIDVQVFYESVEAWKKSLTAEQLSKVKTKLSIYKTLYDRYEVTPTDTKCLQDLLKQQQLVQVLMQKAMQ